MTDALREAVRESAEKIIGRRLVDDRLMGYTLQTSREVRDAVLQTITDSGYAIVPVEPAKLSAVESLGAYLAEQESK